MCTQNTWWLLILIQLTQRKIHTLKDTVASVAFSVKNDTISKIKLFPSSDLSSRDPNGQNNIQLFLQRFEKIRVNGDTN